MNSGGGSNGVLISIILSESTASMLDLHVQNVEEVYDINGNTCVLSSVCKNAVQRGFWRCLVENYWRDDGKNGDKIDEEVAYFSDHFRTDSELSVVEDEGGEFIESIEDVQPMEKSTVYVRPLVSAKSTAHENKIVIADNKIYVNLLNDELHLVSSDLICRICHGGESFGDLLAPCRCRGSIALTHMGCLERWLRESSLSYCELCKHHYHILRQARYSIPWSVLMYLLHPGDNLKDILVDIMAFIVYTPSAVVSTYMLMLICENLAKSQLHRTRNFSAHLVAFFAVFGMATIDFTYSSWLIVTLQHHTNAWRSWYRNNSFLKLHLPDWKKKPYRKLKSKKKLNDDDYK